MPPAIKRHTVAHGKRFSAAQVTEARKVSMTVSGVSTAAWPDSTVYLGLDFQPPVGKTV